MDGKGANGAEDNAAKTNAGPSQAAEVPKKASEGTQHGHHHPLPGHHEHKPSRLAPAEAAEKINEANRAAEAARLRKEQLAREEEERTRSGNAATTPTSSPPQSPAQSGQLPATAPHVLAPSAPNRGSLVDVPGRSQDAGSSTGPSSSSSATVNAAGTPGQEPPQQQRRPSGVTSSGQAPTSSGHTSITSGHTPNPSGHEQIQQQRRPSGLSPLGIAPTPSGQVQSQQQRIPSGSTSTGQAPNSSGHVSGVAAQVPTTSGQGQPRQAEPASSGHTPSPSGQPLKPSGQQQVEKAAGAGGSQQAKMASAAGGPAERSSPLKGTYPLSGGTTPPSASGQTTSTANAVQMGKEGQGLPTAKDTVPAQPRSDPPSSQPAMQPLPSRPPRDSLNWATPITLPESRDSLPSDELRFPSPTTVDVVTANQLAMHSSLAGDIHVSQARRLSRQSISIKRDSLDCVETSQHGGRSSDDKFNPRMTDELHDITGEGDMQPLHHAAFWRRRQFREIWIPSIACAILLSAAITLRITPKHTMVVINFPLWRWLVFFAFTVPIYLICRGLMKLLVVFLEARFFDTKEMLYYLIGIKAWFERTLRIGLTTILFAAIFQASAHVKGKHSALLFYNTALRMLCCATLFAAGMILKTLAAKMLSSHFNKASYFTKMQDALRKEYYLVALSQPRSERMAEAGLVDEKGTWLTAKMIKPFRHMGSVAVMKRLRTASSPFMAADLSAGSATSQGGDADPLRALKSKAPLLPLLPLPSPQQQLAAKAGPPLVPTQPGKPPSHSPAAAAVPNSHPVTAPLIPAKPPLSFFPLPAFPPNPTRRNGPRKMSLGQQHFSIAEEEEEADIGPRSKDPDPIVQRTRSISSHDAMGYQAEPMEQEQRPMLRPSVSGKIQGGPYPPASKPPMFRPLPSIKLMNPAVAFLSNQHQPQMPGTSSDGPQQGRRSGTFKFLPALLKGDRDRERRASLGGNSIGSMRSMVSETQRSLASLESMMSSRPVKGSAMQPIAEDAFQQDPNSQDKDEADFLNRLHRIEEHIRNNKLRVNLTAKLSSAAGQKEDISNTAEARRLAFYIFWNVKASHDKGYITLEDLEVFLPKERAKQCMAVFDPDIDGKVTLHEMRDAVVAIYENRRNLAATLTDTRNVVANLEKVMTVVVQFVLFFAYLAIWNINLQKLWVTLGSMLVSLTFVFGNNMRSMYEAVVYLFVVHPYDVGDAVLVGPNQDWCNVFEIALQTTTFKKWDGSRIVLPNSYLFANMLTNMTRSSNKCEVFKFLVDIGTSRQVMERVGKIATKIAESMPNDFEPKPSVSAQIGSERDPLKFFVQICWTFKYNATSPRMIPTRTKMLLAISDLLRDEGILYTVPPMQKIDISSPATHVDEDAGRQDMMLISQTAVYDLMPQMIAQSSGGVM